MKNNFLNKNKGGIYMKIDFFWKKTLTFRRGRDN